MTETSPKKRGRPRKHSNNAAKQAAYRKRNQDPQRILLIKEILGGRRSRIEGEALMRLSIRQLKRWRRATRRPKGHGIS